MGENKNKKRARAKANAPLVLLDLSAAFDTTEKVAL